MPSELCTSGRTRPADTAHLVFAPVVYGQGFS
jgi:hypothetical protein